MGNTPAYAGKIRPRFRGFFISQEHPRLRGENRLAFQPVTFPSGTPPPTRGKFGAGATVGAGAGNTPAYAGKIIIFILRDSNNKEHPRLRGENPHGHAIDSVVTGTPPPTRGKFTGADSFCAIDGNTPAYAGKIHK